MKPLNRSPRSQASSTDATPHPSPRSMPLTSEPEPPLSRQQLALLEDGVGRSAAAAASAKRGGKRAAPASLDTQSNNSTRDVSDWCTSPKGWTRVRCDHGSEVWIPNRCRHCDGCSAAYRRRVRRRVRDGLVTGENPAFMTLTSLPGTSVEAMMSAWNRFRGWLKRRVPGVEYAAVKEFGDKTGMLHLHIALLGWGFVEQREISAAWKRASRGAYIVDVRRLDDGDPDRVATYVAKYVAKAIGRRDVKKAVTYSRGWPRILRESDWTFADETKDGPTPPVQVSQSTPSGLLVAIDRGCEHLAHAAKFGLAEHLFFWRMQRRLMQSQRATTKGHIP